MVRFTRRLSSVLVRGKRFRPNPPSLISADASITATSPTTISLCVRQNSSARSYRASCAEKNRSSVSSSFLSRTCLKGFCTRVSRCSTGPQSTGTIVTATTSEPASEKQIVNTRSPNNWPIMPSRARNRMIGMNTHSVVRVDPMIAVIISWLPSRADTLALAPRSR